LKETVIIKLTSVEIWVRGFYGRGTSGGDYVIGYVHTYKEVNLLFLKFVTFWPVRNNGYGLNEQIHLQRQQLHLQRHLLHNDNDCKYNDNDKT
jgi:hypothetical protein